MKFDSSLEKKFASLLTSSGIKWTNQFKINNKRFDFYLPDFGILVEIDGNFIHSNEKLGFNVDSYFKKKILKNDLLKNVIAEDSGFKLIRIWEEDLKSLNKNKLIKLLNENKL